MAELKARVDSFPEGQPEAIAGVPGLFSRAAPLPQLRYKLPQEPRFGFWAPLPLPEVPWCCLASSRLGQRHSADPLLLTALEQVGGSLRHANAVVLYARGFALASHLRAVSQRFRLSLLELRPLPPEPDRQWYSRQLVLARRDANLRLFYFQLPGAADQLARGSDSEAHFPSEGGCRPGETTVAAKGAAAAADWLAIHLAATVHVFSCRRGGNIEAALRSRLERTDGLDWSVRLLNSPALTDSRLANALQNAGAARWTLELPQLSSPPGSGSGQSHSCSLRAQESAGESAATRLESTKTFLFHWTRCPALNRRPESDSRCLQMLERMASECHFLAAGKETNWSNGAVELPSPLRTLLEIVTSGRLIASGRWTVNGQPVVSLTAQPLERWRELRTFRAHLGRWDFEPYGIGLNLERVKSLGGRAVLYGDDRVREKLSAAEAVWFQQASTRQAGTRDGGQWIDWTVEREWRVPGDIELRSFRADEAVLFVPDEAAVRVVAPFSRWPVIVVAD